MTANDPRAILERLIAAERSVHPHPDARAAAWQQLHARLAGAASAPAVAATATAGLGKLLAVTLGLALVTTLGLAALTAEPVAPTPVPEDIKPVPEDTLHVPKDIPSAPVPKDTSLVPTATPPVPRDTSLPPQATPPAGWSAELTALQQIHVALRDARPADALALVDEHARRWPHGEFREEVDAARVLALCARGPDAPARRALASFRRRWPASLYTARVRQACP